MTELHRIFPAAALTASIVLCQVTFGVVDGVSALGLNPQRQSIAPLSYRLNYSSLKSTILDSKCLSCHCADVTCEANLVLFSPYQSLIDGKLWSAPAAQSRVIRALTRTDKHRMPPPASSDALPADEIAAIAQWIDAGNPEN